MKKFVLAGFLVGVGLAGSAFGVHAQTSVVSCNLVIGLNGQNSCSPALTPKAYPTATGLTNSVVGIKTTPGQLALVHCYNPNASEIVLQFFNALSGAVTLGTTPPYSIVPIAPSSTGGWALSPLSVEFNTAISVAATTTSTGNTAPALLPDCTVYYQ